MASAARRRAEAYIIRFTEDRPNPLYRRVCYTFAWSEVIAFAVLNITGLVMAIVTGRWHLRVDLPRRVFSAGRDRSGLLGALGRAATRAEASTQGEGHERRYFYGSVWAVCVAQPVLWLLWKVLPNTRVADVFKLVVFVGILALVMGNLARRGRLPRTRPIVPGELAVVRLKPRSENLMKVSRERLGRLGPATPRSTTGRTPSTLGRRDILFWRRLASRAKGRVLELGAEPAAFRCRSRVPVSRLSGSIALRRCCRGSPQG